MSSSAPRIIPEHCSTQTAHRVSVADTDMMGIVHHANYVLLFERGRLEYLRRRGLPYKDMVGRGLHMPVVELNVRYRKPAQFDDLLCVETRLGALSRVTVRFNYVIRRPLLGASPSSAQLAALEPGDLLLEGHILLAASTKRTDPNPCRKTSCGSCSCPSCRKILRGHPARPATALDQPR